MARARPTPRHPVRTAWRFDPLLVLACVFTLLLRLQAPMPADAQQQAAAFFASAICHADAATPGDPAPAAPMADCQLCPLCHLVSTPALPATAAALPAPVTTLATRAGLPPPATAPPTPSHSRPPSRAPPALSA